MKHNYKMVYEELTKLLLYDYESGIFYWKINSKNTKIGQKAGTLLDTGYIRITINGVKFKAHRLAWFMYYKELPSNVIDHINHNRADNRIINLRVVSQSINNRNRITNNNKTGVRLMPSGNYRASIKLNNKTIHIGTFKTIEEAILKRNTFITENNLC